MEPSTSSEDIDDIMESLVKDISDVESQGSVDYDPEVASTAEKRQAFQVKQMREDTVMRLSEEYSTHPDAIQSALSFVCGYEQLREDPECHQQAKETLGKQVAIVRKVIKLWRTNQDIIKLNSGSPEAQKATVQNEHLLKTLLVFYCKYNFQ